MGPLLLVLVLLAAGGWLWLMLGIEPGVPLEPLTLGLLVCFPLACLGGAAAWFLLLRRRPRRYSLTGLALGSSAVNFLAVLVAESFLPTWAFKLELPLGDLQAVAVSPDGLRLATGARDGTLALWDARTGRELGRWRPGGPPPVALAFAPDGRRLAAADGEGRVLFGEPGAGLAALEAPSRETVASWRPEGGPELVILSDDAPGLTDPSFSADGALLLTGGLDGLARVWDAASGRLLRELGRGRQPRFSAIGRRVLAIGKDGCPVVWDADSGREIACLRQGWASLRAVFDPAAARVAATGLEGEVRLLEVSTGEVAARLRGDAPIAEAVFAPDGRTLLTVGGEKRARLWDLAGGRLLAVLAGHADIVVGGRYSADGRRLVTWSWDKTFRLWSAASGRALFAGRLAAGRESPVVREAAFLDGGRGLLLLGEDGRARLWARRREEGLPGLLAHPCFPGLLVVLFLLGLHRRARRGGGDRGPGGREDRGKDGTSPAFSPD